MRYPRKGDSADSDYVLLTTLNKLRSRAIGLSDLIVHNDRKRQQHLKVSESWLRAGHTLTGLQEVPKPTPFYPFVFFRAQPIPLPPPYLDTPHAPERYTATIMSPITASSTATNSTEVSPAYFRFEDPKIDGQLTPLTSAFNSPVNEKEDNAVAPVKDVEVQPEAAEEISTELEVLQARVRESCEGRSQTVEAWGHRGASATWRKSRFDFICPFLSSTLLICYSSLDASAKTAENTMASFRATCQAGAQGIETGKRRSRHVSRAA